MRSWGRERVAGSRWLRLPGAPSREWYGDRVALPDGYAGVPRDASCVLWADLERDTVVCARLIPGSASEEQAAAALAALFHAQRDAPGGLPGRVRVGTGPLGALLRERLEVEVVVRDAEQRADLAFSVAQAIEDADARPRRPGGADRRLWTRAGEEPSREELARYFAATAALYRAAPWDVLATEGACFQLSVAELSPQPFAIMVLGRGEEACGLLIADSAERLHEMANPRARKRAPHNAGPGPGSVVVLMFVDGDEYRPARRRAARREGFRIAGPRAFPLLQRGRSRGQPRRLDRADYLLMTAAAATVADLLLRSLPAFRIPPYDRLAGLYTVTGFKAPVLLDYPLPLVPLQDEAFATASEESDGLYEALEGQIQEFARDVLADEPRETWAFNALLVVRDLVRFRFIEQGREAEQWVSPQADTLRDFLLDELPRFVPLPPGRAAEVPAYLAAYFDWLERTGRATARAVAALRRQLDELAPAAVSLAADRRGFDRIKAAQLEMLAQGRNPFDLHDVARHGGRRPRRSRLVELRHLCVLPQTPEPQPS